MFIYNVFLSNIAIDFFKQMGILTVTFIAVRPSQPKYKIE